LGFQVPLFGRKISEKNTKKFRQAIFVGGRGAKGVIALFGATLLTITTNYYYVLTL